VPLYAIEIARGTGTPLPIVLSWHVGKILFWHGELGTLACM
jgi:hypothetical protein